MQGRDVLPNHALADFRKALFVAIRTLTATYSLNVPFDSREWRVPCLI